METCIICGAPAKTVEKEGGVAYEYRFKLPRPKYKTFEEFKDDYQNYFDFDVPQVEMLLRHGFKAGREGYE